MSERSTARAVVEIDSSCGGAVSGAAIIAASVSTSSPTSASAVMAVILIQRHSAASAGRFGEAAANVVGVASVVMTKSPEGNSRELCCTERMNSICQSNLNV